MSTDTRAHPGGWFWVVIALVPATALAMGWRVWQQLYAFDSGLDSTLPQFQTQWFSVFLLNVIGLPAIATVWYAWIWLSGRKMTAPATPTEEIRRIWTVWMLTIGTSIAGFWGGSFFAEQDAAWHQVTMRDTAFTPSHIALFYGSFPVIFYTAAGAYLYARTRLPNLYGGKRFPLSFALPIAAGALLLFQVAFNEFGHTFWETEEIFSAPLHWPFVLFAFMLGGNFAVWFQTLPRILAAVSATKET